MPRLSWNEIRTRAAVFAKEWEGQGYEKGQTQLFYRELFDVYGVPVRRVAQFEEPVKKAGLGQGFIDLFWKGKLLVEQKSAGRDLRKAREQAFSYFPGISDADLPRYVLTSDFQSFELLDVETNEEVAFRLEDLPKHVEKLGFLVGQEKRIFKDQDPVNLEAADRVGRLHETLERTGFSGHPLERFLVRLVFCLFADDTGIFPETGMFETLVRDRSSLDGSDLGGLLGKLFQTLDTPEDRRQTTLDEDLKAFPYVNGDLFRERLDLPEFDSQTRLALLSACEFNWAEISPAIFGALFQNVQTAAERRKQGKHYTTETNILKVIKPLFLDDLKAELDRLVARRDTGRDAALRAYQDRLANLVFLDPACGCGNFLVIAYREIRQLEIETLQALYPGGQGVLDVATITKVDVDRFCGVELDEWPARIAETAVWMMDHLMNVRLSLAFGQVYARIPLKKSPRIHHGDALETAWETVCPDGADYVFGNPPFIGAKFQTDAQRAQVRRIAALPKSGGTLDYVTAWFLLAGEFVRRHGRGRLGFVATNSITQGEQVAQLWPLLWERYGLEIDFAHRTFAWGSDAKGVAHVHCVIVGLTPEARLTGDRRLFSYPDIRGDAVESRHARLTAYLTGAEGLADHRVVVRETSVNLSGLPTMLHGSKPIDDGNFIFESSADKDAFLVDEPGASPYIRPFVGAREFINGGDRWILTLKDASPNVLRALPKVMARVQKVKEFRLSRSSSATRSLATTPTAFHVTVVPTAPYLAMAQVSSERREYLPIGFMEPPIVPSDKVRMVPGADMYLFGLLNSRIHNAWARAVSGRLESRIQYSAHLTYNAFPAPTADIAEREKIAALARAVLDERERIPGQTLADLYDPNVMPDGLRKAHAALDKAVDRLYRKEPFPSDEARVAHLLALYQSLATPMLPGMTEKPRRKRAPRTSPPPE